MSILGIILLVLAVCFLVYLIQRIKMSDFARNVTYIILAVLTLLFVLWETGLISGLGTPLR